MPGQKIIMSVDEQIGQRITQLRGDRQQQDVAAAIGVSREIMNHWEKGTRKIKAEHLIKLAKYFGVTSDFLLGLPTALVPSDAEKKQVVASYLGITTEAAESAHSFLIDKFGELFEKDEYSPKDLLSDLMKDDSDGNSFFFSLFNLCEAISNSKGIKDIPVDVQIAEDKKYKSRGMEVITKEDAAEFRLAIALQQMSAALQLVAVERFENVK